MIQHPIKLFLLALHIQHISTAKTTCRGNDKVCRAKQKQKRNNKKPTYLRPIDLAPDTIFSNWTEDADYTVDLPYAGTIHASHGSIQQNGNTTHQTKFHFVHSIVQEEEAVEILALLNGGENYHAEETDDEDEDEDEDEDSTTSRRRNKRDRPTTTVPLDEDPDTVDGMATHEIFLDNIELRNGKPSKADPTSSSASEKQKMELRAPLRRQIRLITDPILQERITPFVRQAYPDLCGSGKDSTRQCTPCYSLLRRYVDDERTSHAIHHDGHARVTVVVSLSVRGRDYNGGLFIASKQAERKFVGLTRGDAVVHTSDLYHGVKVLQASGRRRRNEEDDDDEEDEDDEDEDRISTSTNDHSDTSERMERWSWILWYRDSTTCEDYAYEWFQECAEAGNPTCELLHATKVPTIPNVPKEELSAQILYWNQRASDHGHGGASIKVARAYLKLLPSALKYNVSAAKEMYRRAIESSNHPDGHYGLADLLIHRKARGKALRNAVRHLERAAQGGHAYAAFNLGLAHLYGYGMPRGRKNPSVAGEWFEYSGLPEGMWAKAMHSRSIGKEKEAQAFERRAKVMGFGAPWRRAARSKTGSGGAAGVELNLNWPKLKSGEKPPPW
jgi:hypothetical protein